MHKCTLYAPLTLSISSTEADLSGPYALQLLVVHSIFNDIVKTLQYSIKLFITYFKHFKLPSHTTLFLLASPTKLFHVFTMCAVTTISSTTCIT